MGPWRWLVEKRKATIAGDGTTGADAAEAPKVYSTS